MRLFALLALLLLPLPLTAECQGRNLMADLSAAQISDLRARVADVPFSQGNFWTASKDGRSLSIVGTFNIPDLRQSNLIKRWSSVVDDAALVLVEFSPTIWDEVGEVIAKDRSVAFTLSGPSLRAQLTPEDWESYRHAMEDRGIQVQFAAITKPWLATWVLSYPRCLSTDPQTSAPELFVFIVDRVSSRGVPVHAVTSTSEFLAEKTAQDLKTQISLLNETIAALPPQDDLLTTFADAYFAGEVQLATEFERTYLPAIIDLPPGVFQAALNRSQFETMRYAAKWAATLETTKADGPILAAVPAYELPGQYGVLSLLAQNGWTIAPLAP